MKELGTTELAFGGKVFKLILMLRTNVTPWMVNDVGKQRKPLFARGNLRGVWVQPNQ